MPQIRKVSAAEYGRMVKKLAKQIKKSGVEFAYIIGVARGGLPLAVALSNELKIPGERFISLSTRSYDGMTQRENVDVEKLNLDYLKDELVLLVDDLLDTGKTVRSIINQYRFLLPHVAVLFEKNESHVGADYCVEKISSDVWLHFWYEGDL
jgi:uncharacterized protein